MSLISSTCRLSAKFSIKWDILKPMICFTKKTLAKKPFYKENRFKCLKYFNPCQRDKLYILITNFNESVSEKP